ncbi:efflux RND transporter periplasmic adaptor subunit [Paraburkholderia kirstenboschensis]|uniref:Efflux RND transporter periplasmic adaptor subunit n=1 Tax=Paraburkholderia kirstenboschensis TaxID=1245436 RepID=A0ABZ0EAJ4_9BURK|nr:efflux RND transporter periplasmic adaptor subunit [Paraburkholderia kirstenboschensis]WOD13529.1 efflux RND transporter periplasmic adaptor subunit [Paraburkholderia kirstenboschensis]
MNVHREVAAPSRTRSKWSAAIAALVLAGLVVRGIVERHDNVTDLKSVADEESVPQVQVMTPISGPATRTVTLPGNIKAWYTAPIYAQITGYVHKWYVDYGAFVKAGTLLATIDAPTVDEQYQTAVANLDVAKTNGTLADVTAQRWKALAGTEAVAQEEVDVKVADAAAKKAQVLAAQHDLARYHALEGFKNIVAPFDGVVTSRDTDVGNYVNAAGGDVSSRGTADELFSVADIHKMRLFVSVPQDYADMLKPDLQATFTLPQYPARQFKATLLTTANAFNPQTRTVITELVAQNPDHLIWPGTYATVRFVVPTDQSVLVVPEQALLFRDQGMQLAVIGSGDRVHLQNVKLGMNLGQNVQVLSGLKSTDRFIANPSAGTLEGEKVQIVSGVPGIAPEAKVRTAASEPAQSSGNQQSNVAAATSEPR